jgi:hypothetical protein
MLLRLESVVAIEHRGFRVNVDVTPDELGVQWVCRSVIERIDGDSAKGAPVGSELTIPRVKIDPLMLPDVQEPHLAADASQPVLSAARFKIVLPKRHNNA